MDREQPSEKKNSLIHTSNLNFYILTMHKRVFVVIFLLVGTLFTYATSKAQFNAMVGSKAAKNRIEQVAKTIPGVKGVNVNTKQGLVEISYDEKNIPDTDLVGFVGSWCLRFFSRRELR